MKPLRQFCIFIILLCLVAACKKDAAKNELSGAWKVVNVTGTVTGATGVDTGYYIYSYHPADSELTCNFTTTVHPGGQVITQNVSETWNFISTDTCAISYTNPFAVQGSGTGTNHGAYTLTDSLLFLETGTSQLLFVIGIDAPPFLGTYDQFKIESITSTQLVLNLNAQLNDSNNTALADLTFTLSR